MCNLSRNNKKSILIYLSIKYSFLMNKIKKNTLKLLSN